jgi:hypothetical protein
MGPVFQEVADLRKKSLFLRIDIPEIWFSPPGLNQRPGNKNR